MVDKKTQRRLDELENSIQRAYTSIKYKKELLDCENEEMEQLRLAIDMIRGKMKLEEEELEKIITRRKSKEADIRKFKSHHDEVSHLVSQNDRNKSKLIEEISNKETEINALEKASKRNINSTVTFDIHHDTIEKAQQVNFLLYSASSNFECE